MEKFKRNWEIDSLWNNFAHYYVTETEGHKDFVDELRTNSDTSIFSIKRFSDGMIFKVGNYMSYKGSKVRYPIKYFTKVKRKIYINSHLEACPYTDIEDWVR